VLDIAKKMTCNSTLSMTPTNYRYAQWEQHFEYILRKAGICKSGLGVTSHGLRHEYALSVYEQIINMTAPIRQQPGRRSGPDHETDTRARIEVANRLGHTRESISSAYVGSKHPKDAQGPKDAPIKDDDKNDEETDG
jgi:integrase